MGKTFVEDERPCDSCVNRTRYGCVSWNCEYINRDEAIKAWREKNEKADRKTEPTISKMEQVEPQTCSFSDCDNFKNPDYERCIECKRKQIKLKTEQTEREGE